MIEISIKVFRAPDDPNQCEEFFIGHKEVLRYYGIEKITSADSGWQFNPASYVVVASRKDTDELIGGIRMEKCGGSEVLPLVKALEGIDDDVEKYINQFAPMGAGELCGLWNSRNVAGLGVSTLLTKIGVSLSTQLNIKVVFGICGDVTLKMFRKVGYKVDENIGKDGSFWYGATDLIAYSIIIQDANTLENAAPEIRDQIFGYRDQLKQKLVEDGPKGPLLIEYDLLIPDNWLVNS